MLSNVFLLRNFLLDLFLLARDTKLLIEHVALLLQIRLHRRKPCLLRTGFAKIRQQGPSALLARTPLFSLKHCSSIQAFPMSFRNVLDGSEQTARYCSLGV